MYFSRHEAHSFEDPNFPIIFHIDTCQPSELNVDVNWHENIEILYFVEGEAEVSCDTVQRKVKTGELVIFNSNVLHSIRAILNDCRYYCLIIDKSLCEDFGILVAGTFFKEIVRDFVAQGHYDVIIQEMTNRQPYYKAAVKLEAMQLLVHLCRCYTVECQPTSGAQDNRLNMVKKAIPFIRAHFREPLTIDDICEEIGFSKYYFCRVFKEIMGRTVVDYINFMRCNYARTLLFTGAHNVSESAEISGFRNLSYFSKIYKKYIGTLPSDKTSE